ncbi:hypothetical protein AUEXF2481DRAFT_38673 [Aureobasidium subglaciale EXF-2481]|uniref:Uncharacterized protein n=1 Tax=Aureobasidium subglaciale (strain EXF-2481) TaxID=1043005 RepID=A0A074YQM2_AURSE|nr:uncharacterized protein AUEXF2481DRAFT_38673 [Aureobasidium subglaciale EXF-2481]KEQ96407.1 hypothetical protein AUEXF2481DRAFT_38673 [Aureobasidium subglaciale EXF-2481]
MPIDLALLVTLVEPLLTLTLPLIVISVVLVMPVVAFAYPVVGASICIVVIVVDLLLVLLNRINLSLPLSNYSISERGDCLDRTSSIRRDACGFVCKQFRTLTLGCFALRDPRMAVVSACRCTLTTTLET